MQIIPLLQGMMVTGTAHIPGTATSVTVDASALAKIQAASTCPAGTAALNVVHQLRLAEAIVPGGDWASVPQTGSVTFSRGATAAEGVTFFYQLVGQ